MSQVLDALDAANRVRTEGAAIRRGIAAGELDPVQTIRTCTHPIPVRRFLTAIPYIGTVRAERIMREAGIDPWRRFAPGGSCGGSAREYDRGITMEQRERLALIVGGRTAA